MKNKCTLHIYGMYVYPLAHQYMSSRIRVFWPDPDIYKGYPRYKARITKYIIKNSNTLKSGYKKVPLKQLIFKCIFLSSLNKCLTRNVNSMHFSGRNRIRVWKKLGTGFFSSKELDPICLRARILNSGGPSYINEYFLYVKGGTHFLSKPNMNKNNVIWKSGKTQYRTVQRWI